MRSEGHESGAQSAVIEDESQILNKMMIKFLYNFGVVINENDPYAVLQVHMAVSELVEALEKVNQPEVHKIMKEQEPQVNIQEKKFNGFTADCFKDMPKRRKSGIQNTGKQTDSHGGKKKCQTSWKNLYRPGGSKVVPAEEVVDTGSSVDPEEFNSRDDLVESSPKKVSLKSCN